MSRTWMSILATVVLLGVPAVPAEEPQPSHKELKRASKRAKIDEMAAESIKELLAKSEKANVLFNKSYGYAVFDNLKFAFVLSGGGGVGVARNRDTGEKIYMKMGTAGIGLGLGGQKYQVIFLLQDKMTYDSFVDKGWEAGGNANAVAGPVGANAPATFINGMAVYQLTEGGLMRQADIAGTKYWKYKKLNRDS